MRADQKNVRATKPKLVDVTTDESSISARPPVWANEFYTKVVNLSEKVCSDQTDRFPVTSRKGNIHIMIAYDYYYSAILAYLLKPKTSAAHPKAVKLLHVHFNSNVMHPKLHMLDNKWSDLVNDYINNVSNVGLLLVPQCLDRTNAAEKAIDAFKIVWLLVSPQLTLPFPFTCGADYYL